MVLSLSLMLFRTGWNHIGSMLSLLALQQLKLLSGSEGYRRSEGIRCCRVKHGSIRRLLVDSTCVFAITPVLQRGVQRLLTQQRSLGTASQLIVFRGDSLTFVSAAEFRSESGTVS